MGSVNRPERLAAGIAAHVCDVSYGLPALNKSDETAAPPPPYPDGRFLRRCTLALITIPSHADHGASVADPVAREVPALGRSPRKRVPTWRPSSPWTTPTSGRSCQRLSGSPLPVTIREHRSSRSEERGVGHECASTCRYRRSAEH